MFTKTMDNLMQHRCQDIKFEVIRIKVETILVRIYFSTLDTLWK